MIDFPKSGLAIKLKPEGFIPAAEIARAHEVVAKTNGLVYFSTHLPVSDALKNQINMLLVYNNEENVCYLGTVRQVLSGDDDSFRPDDAALYSVPEYAEIPCATWFLLDSFVDAAPESLANFYTVKEGISVPEKMNQKGRFPRFYFREMRLG